MINCLKLVYSKFLSGTERTASVKKNILGSLVIKGVSIIISLLLVPMTLGYVSSEIYGVWITISSILHWMTYMDVGFTLGLKNRLAECIAKKNYEKGKILVSTTYFMMTLIFVPISMILIFVDPYVDWCRILNVDIAYSEIIHKTFIVLYVFVSLQMIVNVFVAVVAAYQKTALSSLFNVIGQVISLLVIFFMTRCIDPSLINLSFAYSLMPILVMGISSFCYYCTSMKSISPSFDTIKLRYAKDLLNIGIKFFIIQIQQIVLYQTTNLLISHISGPDTVTQYNLAYKILNVVVMAYMIVLNPLWPAFTDAYAKEDYQWMKNTYQKLVRLYGVLVIGIIGVVLISPYVYKIWVGDKVNVPLDLTIIVGIYILIHCWDSLQVMLINGIGAISLQTYIIFIGLIIHIPLALFLGKYLGVYGIIISMCLINIIYSSFFTVQIRRILTQKAKGIWIR